MDRRSAALGASAALLLAAAGPASARECAKELPSACLGKLSAGAESLSRDADCGAHFSRYRACLAEAMSESGAAPARRVDADEARAAFEDAAGRGSAAAMRDVAELFPGTYWGRQAAREAERLERAAAGKPAPAAKPAPASAPAAPARERVAWKAGMSARIRPDAEAISVARGYKKWFPDQERHLGQVFDVVMIHQEDLQIWDASVRKFYWYPFEAAERP